MLLMRNLMTSCLCPYGMDGIDEGIIFPKQGWYMFASLFQSMCRYDYASCLFIIPSHPFKSNAENEDCDCDVDECDEDKLPPSIELKTSIPSCPFMSTDNAESFLDENVVISDDCTTNLTHRIELISPIDCENCTF